MNYQTIELSWEELNGVPRNELLMYLACGRISNELNFLQKLLLRSASSHSQDRAVQCAQSSVTFQLITLLAGRLHEALKVLKDHLNVLERDAGYLSEMPPEAKTAWDDLKRGFSKTTIVGQIRDKLAFHNDIKLIDRALSRLTDGDMFEDFHTEEIGNTLFYSADRASLSALQQLTEEDSIVDALSKALIEIRSCTNNVVFVCWGVIVTFYKKRFPARLANIDHSGIVDLLQSLDDPIVYFHESTRGLNSNNNVLFQSPKA